MTINQYDPFRPHQEPQRSIYDAFQAEATKRKSRSVEEWLAAERDAVFLAASALAPSHGLPPPSLDMVVSAERYAMGSVDYGLKWACTLVNMMRRQEQERTAKP